MHVVMFKSDPRAREKPCLRCGYSLRKIESNHCPECGLSAWLSLNQNDTLEMSNADWLRRMSLALLIMAAASLAAMVAFIPVATRSFQVMHHQQEIRDIYERFAAQEDDEDAGVKIGKAMARLKPLVTDISAVRTGVIIGALALGAYFAGLFLLVGEEGRYPDRVRGVRVFARVICAAAAIVLLLSLIQVPRANPAFPEAAAWLTSALGAIVTWRYLRQMARRLPHKLLIQLCTWMMAIPCISLFYSFIRDSHWTPDILPLIFLPASAGLFVWMAILFRKAAVLADKHWKTETIVSQPTTPA